MDMVNQYLINENIILVWRENRFGSLDPDITGPDDRTRHNPSHPNRNTVGDLIASGQEVKVAKGGNSIITSFVS